MSLKMSVFRAFIAFLPDKPTIMRVLGGPLGGRKVCCNFKHRPFYLIGRYEREVVDTIMQTVQPGQVIYDIGANIGYISLLLAKLTSAKAGGIVHAFEPAPNAFRQLNTNMQLNQDLPISAYQVALSNFSGIAAFSFFDYDVVSRLGDHTEKFADAKKTNVMVETMDTYIEKFNIAPPDFIKMDVEGAEMDVLKGMENTLKTHHPTMLIETHSLEEESGKYTIDLGDKVYEYLTEVGYKCEFIQNSHPRQLLARWAK